MSKILVNAVGDACPIPVTKTIHALSGMTEAGTVEVHVDNETAVQNLNRLATGKGLKFSAEKREEKLFVVTLTVDDPAAVSGTAPEEAACAPDNRDNTVVVIGTNCLGSGDDTLGATLMKGFLYALSQQERLPRTILFYNGGAKVTTEGSVSIEDLKNMEAQGVVYPAGAHCNRDGRDQCRIADDRADGVAVGDLAMAGQRGHRGDHDLRR